MIQSHNVEPRRGFQDANLFDTAPPRIQAFRPKEASQGAFPRSRSAIGCQLASVGILRIARCRRCAGPVGLLDGNAPGRPSKRVETSQAGHAGERVGSRDLMECERQNLRVRGVQVLAGHTNLRTTQRYIEAGLDAPKRVVQHI